MKNYETFGVMLDMSRNAVMNVDALKTYFGYLKKMGYNCVMLYTEDTYEVEGEPLFGYMRGRYSADELRELDEYAASLGIELIPCIQTLAHLTAYVRWGNIPFDIDDVMLVGDERCYEFIENLIRSVRKCFRTNRIHIGMDEAWKLGRGKYHNKNGCESATSIIKKHLTKVNEIVKKYGFEPMIWSDMFFRSFSDNLYYIPKTEMPRDVVESVPDDVTLVYWDYYSESAEGYSDMIENHKQLTDKIWFAGGIWTWIGFMPMNQYSIDTMRLALDACKKHKIKNVFFTSWGNNGGECSRYASLPSLFYLSEYAQGNRDEEKIRAKFKRTFGADYEAFMALEDIKFAYREQTKHRGMGDRMALFSDLFNGFLDANLIDGFENVLSETAKKHHESARKYRKWAYMFESAGKLCDVLAMKYTLGLRTREAYQAKDNETLSVLAREEYPKLYKAVEKFALAFEKQWYTENKTYGFDVQDIRIGGLIRRIDSCRRRLTDYLSGKVTRIEELECELIPMSKANIRSTVHNYIDIASANII